MRCVRRPGNCSQRCEMILFKNFIKRERNNRQGKSWTNLDSHRVSSRQFPALSPSLSCGCGEPHGSASVGLWSTCGELTAPHGTLTPAAIPQIRNCGNDDNKGDEKNLVGLLGGLLLRILALELAGHTRVEVIFNITLKIHWNSPWR